MTAWLGKSSQVTDEQKIRTRLWFCQLIFVALTDFQKQELVSVTEAPQNDFTLPGRQADEHIKIFSKTASKKTRD